MQTTEGALVGNSTALKPKDLIGAWTLVRWEIGYSDDRPVSLPYGADAEGTIMYTPDGYMNAVLRPKVRGPVSTPYVRQAPADEKARLFDTFMVYGGPYRIKGNDVIHTVVHALNPDLAGTEQVRHVAFEGDHLILSGEEKIAATGLSRLHRVVWKRAGT